MIIAANFPIYAIGKKPEKIRALTGFEHVTSAIPNYCDTGGMLYQLSYEARHWERGQLMSSREE